MKITYKKKRFREGLISDEVEDYVDQDAWDASIKEEESISGKMLEFVQDFEL